jgi:hypothetical protein
VLTGCGVLGKGFGQSLRDSAGGPDVFQRGELCIKDPVSILKRVIFVVRVVRVVQQEFGQVLPELVIIVLTEPVICVDSANSQDQSGSELPDDAGDSLRLLTLSSGLIDAGRATRRASAHLDLPGIPVDLGVMLLEPGVPEDKLLLTEPSYSELDSFAMTLVTENQSRDVSDEAGLVGGAVYIEHQDGLREPADWDPTHLNILGVNEVGGCSTVDKPIERELHSIVGRLDLQWKVEGVSTRRRSDCIALRKFALPSRLTGRTGGRSGQWRTGDRFSRRGSRSDRLVARVGGCVYHFGQCKRYIV